MGSAGKKSEWKLGNFMGSFFKALLFVNIEWFHGARSLLVNIFIFCRVSSIRTLTLGWRDLLHGTVRRIWGCLGHIETVFCLKIVTNVSVGASRVHIIFFHFSARALETIQFYCFSFYVDEAVILSHIHVLYSADCNSCRYLTYFFFFIIYISGKQS